MSFITKSILTSVFLSIFIALCVSKLICFFFNIVRFLAILQMDFRATTMF